MDELQKLLSRVNKEGAKRAAVFTRDSIDSDARTVEIAFSSEEPYERRWGIEILDHGSSSVDLKRLNGTGCVLFNHDRDALIGKVEKAWVDQDRVARAVVRIGKSQAAEEMWKLIEDGILRNISVGYAINDLILESEKDGVPTYRVTGWEPHEISFVSIPADTTVGVGREHEPSKEIIVTNQTKEVEKSKMEKEELQAKLAEEQARAAESARKEERQRVTEIQAIAERVGLGVEALEYIRDGKTVSDFQTFALNKISEREKIELRPAGTPEIGMSKKEITNYSVVRALAAQLSGDWSDAGLEKEASLATAKAVGTASRGFMIPFDVMSAEPEEKLRRALLRGMTRDLTVGTSTAGGHTVATDLLSGSFIELLRAKMVLNTLGITYLTGLNGNIAIPSQTGSATGYWVGEGVAPSESQQAFGQVAMTPKTVGAFTEYTRKLLYQSSIDVEAFVRMDLATVLALMIETAAISGPGSGGAPTGILSTAGIGAVALGPNGTAPTWDMVVDLESAVANVNADATRMAYLTNTKVRGKLKKTLKAAGIAGYIWDTSDPSQPLNNTNVALTNLVPSNLTKGSSSGICSAMIYGNFEHLMIGQWAALDMLVNPYGRDTEGIIRVTAFADVDVAVRNPASFSACQDILTT